MNNEVVIKVAIYEDNESLRDILASIIRESEEFELSGEFSHCKDALKNTEVYKPDVVIMDIDMPEKNGIEGTKEIKSAFPKVEVIINTVFDDDDKIINALEAGATGYLLKRNSLSTLLSAVKDVVKGGAPMSPAIARRVLQLPFINQKTKNDHNLSKREFQILNLMAQGKSYKMVSSELFLSLDSVRTYIKRIYEKLHVHSVTEAVYKVFIDKN